MRIIGFSSVFLASNVFVKCQILEVALYDLFLPNFATGQNFSLRTALDGLVVEHWTLERKIPTFILASFLLCP